MKDDAVLRFGQVAPAGGCLADRTTFHPVRRDGASLATILIVREGTIDQGFAPNSIFQASVQRTTKLQLVER